MLISVRKAAQFLGVSERRIRALLAQGRIRGGKLRPDVTGCSGHTRWLVEWPLDVKPGKRGPDLQRFPVRLAYGSPEPRSGVRQGTCSSSGKKIASRASGEV